MQHEDSRKQLYSIIERIVKMLRDDYVSSRSSGLIKDREEIYRAFYQVEHIPLTQQERPVAFIDAGFHTFESDVISLMIISIGACVRDEHGRILYLNDLGDFVTPEYIILYSRWIEENNELKFTVRIIPLQEGSFLIVEDQAEKLSAKLTHMLNAGLRRDKSKEKTVRLFKRLLKYIEGLMEIAYGVRIQDLVGSKTVSVVDGTLTRWFGMKHIGFFSFDGLDILSVLTNKTRENIMNQLRDIHGLVKTTKFTSISRARWLFRNSTLSAPYGLYANTSPERAVYASVLINEKIKSRYGDEIAEDTVLLFNRVTYKWSNIWTARFPVTTNGEVIFHLESHTTNSLIEYRRNMGSLIHPDTIEEISKRVNDAISNIMAYRTRITGLPPFGFMEIDNHVRIPMKRLRNIQDIIISIIRKETGEIGHPLEYLFEYTRRLRLGY